MIVLDLIQVVSTSVVINDSADAQTGTFELVSLQTDFSVGKIPTCTAVLSYGTYLGDVVYTDTDVVQSMLSKYTNGGLSIQIYFKISVNNKKYDICVFKGNINTISLAQAAAAYGNSRSTLVITAFHRLSDLYGYGTAGMVYAAPEAVRPGVSLKYLKNATDTNKGADKRTTSTTLASEEIISKILQDYCEAPHTSSSTKSNQPIADTLNALVDALQDTGVLIPGAGVKLLNYIVGKTKIKRGFKRGWAMTKNMLRSLWTSVNASSLGSAIINTVIASDAFLTIAPRSVDTITIIPADGVTLLDKHPVLKTDMYSSIQYSTAKGPEPEPTGVIVCAAGSVLNVNVNKQTVQGKYPADSNNTSRLWATVPAPAWLVDDIAMYEGTAKDKKADGVDNKSKEAYCNDYAEWMYKMIIGKSNSCTITSDIRLIEAFKALGSVCVINTVLYGNLQGYFSGYALSYNQSTDTSSLSIKLSFTQIQQYIKSDVKKPDSHLYVLDDGDIIDTFPDISKA